MNILQLNTEKETIKFNHVTYVNSIKTLHDIRTALSTLFYVPKSTMSTLRCGMPELKVLNVVDNCSVDIEYAGANLTCNIKAGKNGKPLYSGFKDWFNEFYRLSNNDCPVFACYDESIIDIYQYENAARVLRNYCYLGWNLASNYIKNMQYNIKNEWLDWWRENQMMQHTTDFSEQGKINISKKVTDAREKIDFYERYLSDVTEGLVQGLYVRPTDDLKDDELVLVTKHGHLTFDELSEYKDMIEITLDLAYRQLKSKSSNGIILINKKVRGIERIIGLFPQYQFIINVK